jgi:starch synthase (maltosyl-transferring)
VISRINKIRNEHASLQQTNNIVFCATNNDKVMAYYKFDDEKQDETLMVASLDSNYTSQSMVLLPQELLRKLPLKITDLVTGNSYIWEREWNFVEISPDLPFHLFKVEN